ncbi:type I restriction enzyme S subunit [Rhizobium azibense]|nr:type I restriction enzyme S subunit [Rhizobium azibense]
MSREMPDGWAAEVLSDICDDISVGIASSATHAYRAVGVPLIRNQNINHGRVDTSDLLYLSPEYDAQNASKRVRAGDVISMRTGYPGRSAIVPAHLDGAHTFTTLITRPNKQRLLPEFFVAWMNSDLGSKATQRLQAGGAQQNLNVGALKTMAMLLPPLHEQRLIAEILSSVDEAIAATRAVIEQTRKVKQGVLERLLTKGIGHTRFKQTEIGEIPEGWEVAEVQEHFHVQLGKMLSKEAKIGENPSPYLRNANVQWGRIETTDVLCMDFSEYEKEKFRLQPGDLLVCEGGEVGRCAIWNEPQEIYFQKALHRLREKSGFISNQFLMYVLTRIFTSKALSAGLVGANSIAHFTREQFLRLKLPMPDVAEQNAVCEALGALENSVNRNILKLQTLTAIKSALMSDLLTGRKRVTDALPMAAE